MLWCTHQFVVVTLEFSHRLLSRSSKMAACGRKLKWHKKDLEARSPATVWSGLQRVSKSTQCLHHPHWKKTLWPNFFFFFGAQYVCAAEQFRQTFTPTCPWFRNSVKQLKKNNFSICLEFNVPFYIWYNQRHKTVTSSSSHSSDRGDFCSKMTLQTENSLQMTSPLVG